MDSLRNGRIERIKRADGGKSFRWSKETLVLVVNYFESSKVDFLDEPTTGMDLEAVDNFWKLETARVYICCGDP